MIGGDKAVPKLRIGIVGMGVMGWQYAEILSALPHCTLEWICDIDEERLREAQQRFHVPTYADYRRVLDSPVDGVIIATPDNYHLQPCVDFAKSRKHILVEKPLATTLKDAEEIVKVCKEEGVKLMVGHILRFDPRYVLLKQKVGEVGDLIHIYTRRNNLLSNARRIKGRTSPLFFLAIHDVDILCWLKGSLPEWVFASANSKLLRGYGTYDSAFLLMQWEDGTLGCVETSWVLPDDLPSALDAQLEVVGERGAIYLQIDNHCLRMYSQGQAVFPDTAYHLIVEDMPFGILRQEVEHFLLCIERNEEPAITGEDGLRAVRVVEGAERAIKSGEKVRL